MCGLNSNSVLRTYSALVSSHNEQQVKSLTCERRQQRGGLSERFNVNVQDKLRCAQRVLYVCQQRHDALLRMLKDVTRKLLRDFFFLVERTSNITEFNVGGLKTQAGVESPEELLLYYGTVV